MKHTYSFLFLFIICPNIIFSQAISEKNIQEQKIPMSPYKNNSGKILLPEDSVYLAEQKRKNLEFKNNFELTSKKNNAVIPKDTTVIHQQNPAAGKKNKSDSMSIKRSSR